MYGWRGKIGLIVPSPNTVAEVEVNKLLPFGIFAYTSRCFYPETNDVKEKYEFYQKIEKPLFEATDRISSIKPDLIVWACTLGSLLQGPNCDIEISKKIEEISGYPAISTTTSVIRYIRYFNFKKILLITPYSEFFTNALKKYLLNEIVDLKISDTYSEEIIEGISKGSYFPEIIYQKIIKIINNHKKIDAIFISCTNWPTLKIIKILEKDTGIKTFSSITATVWYALKKMGREKDSNFNLLGAPHL